MAPSQSTAQLKKGRHNYAMCGHCGKRVHRNMVRRHQNKSKVQESLRHSIQRLHGLRQGSESVQIGPQESPRERATRILSRSGIADLSLDDGERNCGDGEIEETEWEGHQDGLDLDEMESIRRKEMNQEGCGEQEDAQMDLELGPEPSVDQAPTVLPHVDLLLNAASSSESAATSGEEIDLGYGPEFGSGSEEEEEEESLEGAWPLEYGVSQLLPFPLHHGQFNELEVARAVQREGIPEDSALYNNIRAFRYQLSAKIGANAFKALGDEFPELELPSLKVLRRVMKELSGIEPSFTDCCRKSCMCYTADLADLTICPICGSDRYKSDGSPANQLLHVPISPQLKAMYAGRKSSQVMRYRSQHENDYIHDPEGTIADIYDSKIYRSLRQSHPVVDHTVLPHHFLSDPRDVLLVGLTDGFQVFRRGKNTAWPVIYINANLSPEDRYKDENIIIVGLIPGPNKPKNFNSFMYRFTEELVQGAVGVPAYDVLEDDMFTLHFYGPFGGGDMPAVAAAYLNSKGHNAKHPCRDCHIEAVRMEESDNLALYLPLRRPPEYTPTNLTVSTLPLRNHQQYLRQAEAIDMAPTIQKSKDLAVLYGINGVPVSSKIPGVQLPSSFPLDLMHLSTHLLSNQMDFFSGKFKKLSSGSEDYILPKEVWAEIGAATEAANKTIPAGFGRQIPNVAADRTYFTAESYLVWSTLYAPILLRGRFSREKYYTFFRCSISIIERCMAFRSTASERDKLREDIKTWYLDYERIFYQYKTSRLPTCLLTVHAWLHVVDEIENAGPLPCFWCWCMERLCGRLCRAVTSRKHPYASLNRRITELQTLRAVINKYDLQNRLSTPRRTRKRSNQTLSFEADDEEYDDYTLLGPVKSLDLSSGELADLRRRIAVCLATELNVPVKAIKAHLHRTVTQWARVQIHDGDLIRSYMGCPQSAAEGRDATFVQYELLVDIYARKHKKQPLFESRTFFGRLERAIVCAFPPTPELGLEHNRTFVLADILPCKTTQDKYGFYEYTTFAAREVMNLNALRAVVGRIFDRGKWVIVRRSGGIEHAHYVGDDDIIIR